MAEELDTEKNALPEGSESVEAARADEKQSLQPGDVVYRHKRATRIWHWINAGTLLIMLMSGLMIFNAHPHLYWGHYGANFDPHWLEIADENGRGYIEISGFRLDTTGIFGVSTDAAGDAQNLAFPGWATIPGDHYDLAAARRWHLFFAWVLALPLLAYMLTSLFNGHVKRDLHIKREEWKPSHIWHDISEHAKLRFPKGAAARDYNILQKFSYIGVIFILIPAMIFTGLTMSPGMDAAWPWLVEIFGGRQSARSIHFICAFSLVAFFLVHIAMVVLAGPVNEVRSMITGRYRLPGKVEPTAEAEPEEQQEQEATA